MKIECLLKRIGGTKAEIGGKEYHFAEQSDGSHVAEVADKEHVARFLSIKESYRAVGGTKQSAPTAPQPLQPDNLPQQPADDPPAEPVSAQSNPLAIDDAGTTAEPVQPTGSITEQDELIAKAKALGIRANRNWGIARLKSEILAIEGQ